MRKLRVFFVVLTAFWVFLLLLLFILFVFFVFVFLFSFYYCCFLFCLFLLFCLKQLSVCLADPELMQINLTGFLEEKAAPFMDRLWALLLSAQDAVGGIPPAILEAKKAEIRAAQAAQARVDAQVSATHRDIETRSVFIY